MTLIKPILEMSPDELLIDIERFRKMRIEVRQRQISNKRAESESETKRVPRKPKNDIEMDDVLKEFLT